MRGDSLHTLHLVTDSPSSLTDCFIHSQASCPSSGSQFSFNKSWFWKELTASGHQVDNGKYIHIFLFLVPEKMHSCRGGCIGSKQDRHFVTIQPAQETRVQGHFWSDAAVYGSEAMCPHEVVDAGDRRGRNPLPWSLGSFSNFGEK